MCKTTICVLVVLAGSSSFGQSATTKNKKNYPQIVAKVHVTGRTAPIPLTTLLVPKKDGLYRVTAYMASTNKGDWGQYDNTFNMTWIDDLGVEGSGDICIIQPGDGIHPVYWSATMRVNANTPLSYSVLPGNCGNGGITYEVFFTVERLE
jgi:hypothetical protein